MKVLLSALIIVGTLSSAQAQIPVTDVSALIELQQQVGSWTQQLRGMAAQLQTMQLVLAGQSGQRGMQRLVLLTPSARNYLPSTAGDLQAIRAAPAAPGVVGNAYAATLRAIPVLPPAALAPLAARDSGSITEGRQALAMESALMQATLEHASTRFAVLQALIDAIPAATDSKGIAELQARIASEQAMLLNEQMKIAALRDWAAVQLAIADARRRETIALGHGSFASRFQPIAP